MKPRNSDSFRAVEPGVGRTPRVTPRRLLRSVATAAGLAVMMSVALAGFAPPASAATTSCEMSTGEHACQTGILGANPTYHAIYISARTYSDHDVTCRAHDTNNGYNVGQVTDKGSGGSGAVSKVIRGLYGHYFVICVSNGYSSGRLSNDSLWVK